MGRRFPVLLCASLLSACATRPDRIPATAIPADTYMASDCAQLSASMADARSQLEKLWSMQNTKADLDTTSVLVAFVPASVFTGDHAKEVAQAKGQLIAIGTALASKGCSGSTV